MTEPVGRVVPGTSPDSARIDTISNGNSRQVRISFTTTGGTGNQGQGTSVQRTGIPTASMSNDVITIKSDNTEIATIKESPGWLSNDAWLVIKNGGKWKLKEKEYSWGTPDNLNMSNFHVSGGRITTDDAVGQLYNTINGELRNVKTDNNGRMTVEVTPGQNDYVALEEWMLMQHNGSD